MRRPVGLVLVEIGGADLADLVRDGLPPRQAGAPLRVLGLIGDEDGVRIAVGA